MATYVVRCGYRKASNFPSQTDISTEFVQISVTADNPEEARREAIDKCYRLFGSSIEHVKPIFGIEEIND